MHRNVIVILILSMFLNINLQGQDIDTLKTTEFYLTSSSLTGNSFGLQIKREIKDLTFLRLGLVNLDIEQQKFSPATTLNFPYQKFEISGDLKLGIEKRAILGENSTFFYGINANVQYAFQRNRFDNPTLTEDLRKNDFFNLRPGISFHTGMIMQIKNSLFFAAEFEPEFLYYISKSEISNTPGKNTRTVFDFNLNSQTIKVSLIYRLESIACQ